MLRAARGPMAPSRFVLGQGRSWRRLMWEMRSRQGGGQVPEDVRVQGHVWSELYVYCILTVWSSGFVMLPAST